jgi:glycosyltransferase involved in cell wall biosynthesis
MKKLSFVIPVYNEEGNLLVLYEKLKAICQHFSHQYAFEILFVNDGSRDSSWHIIKELAAKDSRVRGISFSRNFGFQMTLTAAYDYAQGDAIIGLDADLQDPPELICEMIEKWEEGFYIVYARRSSRNDGFIKDVTASLYYKLLHYVSDVPIPQNVGDFRLIDKRVLQQVRLCRERARYLRGIVAWTGFRHTFVEFKRPERTAGVSGYSWLKLLKLAFDGVTAFSLFPLRIAAFVGIFVIFTGLLMFAYIAFDALVQGARYPLFKWLVTIIYIFMGVQFLLMWLLGEYIGRIYDQQKNRPLYIIQESIGKGFEER